MLEIECDIAVVEDQVVTDPPLNKNINHAVPTRAEIEHFQRINKVAEGLVARGANVVNGVRMSADALARLMCSRSPVSKHWSRVRTFAIQGIARMERGIDVE